VLRGTPTLAPPGGEVEGGVEAGQEPILAPRVEDERVWMTFDCGAGIAHRLEPRGPDR
jgi:hypothetical protein